jgi:TRAP-type C4-dicarboxylate transport system substrate-binding protein
MVRQAFQAVGRGFQARCPLGDPKTVALHTVFLLALASAAHAQTAIKLATLVPEGSVWDKNIKQMGEEWKTATGGRVTVTVFAGGSQGDEPMVLRKMRLDALQAASLSAVGLGTIDAAFNVFDIPFFFDSYDELNYVTEKLTPTIRKRSESKGFILLNWGQLGWAQVFTKKPVQTVDDLKTIKLWTSSGNDRMVQWFKANGFQPRAMAMTDIMTGLSTGMIDGMPSTPLAAMLFQWNRQTPYMLELGLAPIIGASVITSKTWKAIPDADKPKLLEAADGVEKRLNVEVPKLDQNAVAMMTKNGLTVTKPTGPEWRAQLDGLAKTMRGEMVPPDIFDLAVKARDEFRKNKQKQ